jgi:hypothetical protein
LLLGALGAAACSSWSGPSGGSGGPAMSESPIDGREGGMIGEDGGKAPIPDAGPDGAASDGGSELTLGDPRPGFEACGEQSCDTASVCCSASGGEHFQCMHGCGPTEGPIECDGPEDCAAGEVCCHQPGAAGVRGACLAGEPSATDGGSAAPPQCVTLPDGPEQRVACHHDGDCAAAVGMPLCRAASGYPFLGYCTAEADDPTTPGHDDAQLVGCGDPDHDGIGASCMVNGQVCCLSRESGDVAACADGDRCGFSELPVRCDGPEDCATGLACCHVPEQHDADGGVSPAQTLCTDRCAELPAALTRCHADQDCGSEGQVCRPDPTSPWWGSCAIP